MTTERQVTGCYLSSVLMSGPCPSNNRIWYELAYRPIDFPYGIRTRFYCPVHTQHAMELPLNVTGRYWHFYRLPDQEAMF
jgi:hypothetical protein